MPRFSVVVLARGEEDLGACLDSIDDAAVVAEGDVEIVVVATRCTGRTAAISSDEGVRFLETGARTAAELRNAGVATSAGDIVVTIDGDSLMSASAFVEIDRKLRTGRYVGGGASSAPEPTSPGIAVTTVLRTLRMLWTRVGCSMLWCSRADFDAIGGFDAGAPDASELDFGRRLRRSGRLTGRRFTNLYLAPVVTSCRRFDRRDDRHELGFPRAAAGEAVALGDRLSFDVPA